MWRGFVWVLLTVMRCGLLFAAVFPLFSYWRFEEPWQTALVASKLMMLPVGMMCLFGAVALKRGRVRG